MRVAFSASAVSSALWVIADAPDLELWRLACANGDLHARRTVLDRSALAGPGRHAHAVSGRNAQKTLGSIVPARDATCRPSASRHRDAHCPGGARQSNSAGARDVEARRLFVASISPKIIQVGRNGRSRPRFDLHDPVLFRSHGRTLRDRRVGAGVRRPQRGEIARGVSVASPRFRQSEAGPPGKFHFRSGAGWGDRFPGPDSRRRRICAALPGADPAGSIRKPSLASSRDAFARGTGLLVFGSDIRITLRLALMRMSDLPH